MKLRPDTDCDRKTIFVLKMHCIIYMVFTQVRLQKEINKTYTCTFNFW